MNTGGRYPQTGKARRSPVSLLAVRLVLASSNQGDYTPATSVPPDFDFEGELYNITNDLIRSRYRTHTYCKTAEPDPAPAFLPMTTINRLVVVDDTSPSITYSIGWEQDTGRPEPETRNDIVDYGPVYNGTEHYTSTNGTQFFFTFQGTGFRLYARSDWDGLNASSLSCAVDGDVVFWPPPFPDENNQLFCNVQSLRDGTHNVVGTVTTTGLRFQLDYILYEPLSTTDDASLQNQTLFINDNYTSIAYGAGWVPAPNDDTHSTQVKGATLKFNFFGTGITWYGVTTNHTSTSATYSIDGGAETTFAIPLTPKRQYNQKLFSVPNLPPGSHSLTVTHQGDETQAELIFDYFIIAPNTGNSILTSASSASGPTSGVSPTTSTPTPTLGGGSANAESNSGLPIAAIVGGVVGGVVAIVVLVLLWLLYRKRSSSPTPRRMSLIQDDSPVLPEAFITSPVEQGPTILSLPSSPSMRQADLSSAINTSLSRPASPALQSSLMRSNSYEQAHSVITGSSASQTNPGPGSSVKADTGSRLRLVHHEDSGNRFNQGEETVVEVPPGYTES